MRLFLLLTLVLSSWTTWADEAAKGGDTETSPAPKVKHHCDPEKLGARAKAGAHGTFSHLRCKVAVNAALKAAGCNVAIGGPASYNTLSGKGWHCSRKSLASAPDGSVVMYQRGSSDRHYEIKYKDCYYSDFHHAQCLPATQYHSGPFRLLGWCAP